MNFRPGDLFLEIDKSPTAPDHRYYLLVEKRLRCLNNRGKQELVWRCFTTVPRGNILEIELDEHTLERWFEVEADVFEFHRAV